MKREAIVAAIDIGAHTAGLAVCRLREGDLEVMHDASRFTRLGAEVAGTGRITEAALDRTCSAVADLCQVARGMGASSIHGAVTSPGRLAKNAPALLSRLGALGLKVMVVSGEDEAKLTWEGVATAHVAPEPPVTLDIGGGSTEICWRVDDAGLRGVSLELGVVQVSEQFWTRDPPRGEEVERAEAWILNHMSKGLPLDIPAHPLVAVAGTPRSLAWLTGQDPTDGTAHLSLSQAMHFTNRLLTLSGDEIITLDERLVGREQILPAGALILLCLMRHLQRDHVGISHLGLRHGLAWRLATGRLPS